MADYDDEMEEILEALRAAADAARQAESEARALGEHGEATRHRMQYHRIRREYDMARESTSYGMMHDFAQREKALREYRDGLRARRAERKLRKQGGGDA
jgi:hypothetical protein